MGFLDGRRYKLACMNGKYSEQSIKCINALQPQFYYLKWDSEEV